MDLWLLVARVLIGVPFLAFGTFHVMNREQMIGFAAMKTVPYPQVTVPLGGIWQIVGALSVILGIYPLVGAWILLAWLVVVSALMHPFWSETGDLQRADMTQVLKHAGWGGALLGLIVLNEWGRWVVTGSG